MEKCYWLSSESLLPAAALGERRFTQNGSMPLNKSVKVEVPSSMYGIMIMARLRDIPNYHYLDTKKLEKELDTVGESCVCVYSIWCTPLHEFSHSRGTI